MKPANGRMNQITVRANNSTYSRFLPESLSVKSAPGGVPAAEDGGLSNFRETKLIITTIKPTKNKTQTGSVNWIPSRTGKYEYGISVEAYSTPLKRTLISATKAPIQAQSS